MSAVIATIKSLANTDDLTQEIANELILKHFKRTELKVTKGTKLLFRHFIVKYITTVPKEDLEEVLKDVNIAYHKLYTNLATLDVNFTKDVRKQFKKGSDEHKMSLKLVKLTYEDKGKLINTQKKSLEIKHSERIRFSGADTLNLIRRLNDSTDANDKLISLMLSSGARPVELLLKSNFEKAENNTTNQQMTVIKQNELAKKRNAEGTFSIKPLLVLTFKEFSDSLSFVRNHFESEKDSLVDRRGELKQKFLTKPNAIMKELYNFADDVTLYSARGMYVVLSFWLYSKSGLHGADPTIALWANKVLGHKEFDLNTQNHYSKFDLVENDQPVEDIKKDVVILKEKVGEIEEKVDQQDLPLPSVITNKQSLKNAQEQAIEKEFKKHEKISQSALEQALSSKVPRALVRSWYRQNKINSLTKET